MVLALMEGSDWGGPRTWEVQMFLFLLSPLPSPPTHDHPHYCNRHFLQTVFATGKLPRIIINVCIFCYIISIIYFVILGPLQYIQFWLYRKIQSLGRFSKRSVINFFIVFEKRLRFPFRFNLLVTELLSCFMRLKILTCSGPKIPNCYTQTAYSLTGNWTFR